MAKMTMEQDLDRLNFDDENQEEQNEESRNDANKIRYAIVEYFMTQTSV